MATTATIDTALVADPNAIFRLGMRGVLRELEVGVVGEAEDVRDLMALLRMHRPAFAFVDSGLARRPEGKRLATDTPDGTRLVFLVEADISSDELVRLIQLGAAGCLEHNLKPDALGRCIDALRRGEVALSRSLTRRLCAGLQASADRERAVDISEKLTPREREVLRHVSQAARNRDIARALSISEHTVKRHVQNILQKLELPTRVAAATYFERGPFSDKTS